MKNGGKGSNRSVARIILESPLVEIYQNVHAVVARNFMHMKQTTSHSDPNMTMTFEGLVEKMASSCPHIMTPGRSSAHSIPDLTEIGYNIIEKGEKSQPEGNNILDDLDQPDVEDIIGEL